MIHFCNDGKNFSSNSNLNYYILFKCTHGSGHCGDVINRQSTVYQRINRSQSKSLPRRSKSDRSFDHLEQNCSYSFQISFDSNGYFL